MTTNTAHRSATLVNTAVHVTESAAMGGRPPGRADSSLNYFVPLSFSQCLPRLFDVYLGHFDTFFTITAMVATPVFLSYHWMAQGDLNWIASTFYLNLVIPFANLVAEGAAVMATAWIYLGQGQPKPSFWKTHFEAALQKGLFARWILQVLRSWIIGRWLLVPTGMLAFSSPLFLLQRSSLIGCLLTSARIAWFNPIVTLLATLVVTFGIAPSLSWVLQHFVINLVVGSSGAAITPGAAHMSNDATDVIIEDDFWSQRYQIQEIIALPLTSCLWTILYLNICITRRRGGMTRETLAKDMGFQLQAPLSPSICY